MCVREKNRRREAGETIPMRLPLPPHAPFAAILPLLLQTAPSAAAVAPAANPTVAAVAAVAAPIAIVTAAACLSIGNTFQSFFTLFLYFKMSQLAAAHPVQTD